MNSNGEVLDGTIQLGKGNSEKSRIEIYKVTVEIDGKQSVWWKVYQRVPDGRNWQFTRKVFIAYAPTRDDAFFQAKFQQRKEKAKLRFKKLLDELLDTVSEL